MTVADSNESYHLDVRLVKYFTILICCSCHNEHRYCKYYNSMEEANEYEEEELLHGEALLFFRTLVQERQQLLDYIIVF